MNQLKKIIVIGVFSFSTGFSLSLLESLSTKLIDSRLPDIDEIDTIHRPGTITIISTNNILIQKIGPATRDKVSKDEIPDLIKNAFISSEDRRFYKHKGVDLIAIIRAISINIKERGFVEGGSTITQQLARIKFLNQEKTISRKLKEVSLAYKLERNLTKQEILEEYLNNVYLGSGAYGISDASWVYFSKDVGSLTLEESALLAGLAPAPSLYSPLVNSKLAIEQRNKVLLKMYHEGFISKKDLENASKSPLNLKPAKAKYSSSPIPFFTSWVEKKLPEILTKDELELGGLTVKTSVNLSWQFAAQEIIRTQNPENTEGAIISLESNTGLVRALVGGNDFKENEFNRATQAMRSPGSTSKLFTYAAALEKGYEPQDIFFDTPRCWYGYCPKNFGNIYYGEISMEDAFAFSINTIAVELIDKVGFKRTINVANRLGVGKLEPLGKYHSIAIGGHEETLLNMTAAYSAVANEGLYNYPMLIEKIIGPDGSIIWDQSVHGKMPKQALSKDVAKTLHKMLLKSVNEGTGIAASIKDIKVAGKTGTSEGARDLWFIGSANDITTGLWFGHDSNKSTQSTSGDAAHIWKLYMQKIMNY